MKKIILATIFTLFASTSYACDAIREMGDPLTVRVPATKLYPVCQDAYMSMFREDTRTPYWVATITNRDWIGENGTRDCPFRIEQKLPRGMSPTNNDYLHARDRAGRMLARGHNIAAANFYGDSNLQHQSCSFANIFPQVQVNNNSGIWSEIETWERKSTFRYGPHYILVTSTYKEPFYRINGAVAVPDVLYKAVCSPKLGRAIYFRVENRPYEKADPNDMVISHEQFVAETTIEPFTNGKCLMESIRIW